MTRTETLIERLQKCHRAEAWADGVMHPEKAEALMPELLRLLELGECERCGSVGSGDLSGPVALPSGRVARVCGVCLSELRPVGGRTIYTRQ